MRIGYFYDIALPSEYAASIQILNTCHALASLGAEVTVYCGPLDGNDPDACLRFYGLQPHANLRLVPNAKPAGGYLGRTPGSLTSGDSEILLSRGEPGLGLFRKVRARKGLLRVYEAHRLCSGWLEESPPASTRPGQWLRAAQVLWLRRLERKTVESADGLVCLTQGVHDALDQAFRIRCPVLILPSGTSIPSQTTRAPHQHREFDVVYVGKLERRKGVQDVILAMKHLPGRTLWVVGGTPSEVAEFARVAESAGVGDHVHFTGYVEPTRVREILDRARVGVCPLPTGISSVSETFTSPLKILDMMASGVPIVATNVPSVREILRHEHHALLVPPDDPRALADSIQRLLNNPVLSASLSQAARDHVVAFSWENRARRLFNYLESIHP